MSVVADIRNYNYLLKQLVKVNWSGQYRKSFFGGNWILILSLFNILLWYFLHREGLFNPGNTDLPYPIYLISGIMFWNLLYSSMDSVSDSIVGNSSLVLDMKFPHIILVLEKLWQPFLNFIISYCVFLIVLVVSKVDLHWSVILIPIFAFPLLLLGTALGMFLALLKVVFLDFTIAFTRLFALVIYISPVIVSQNSASPLLRYLIKYNPITYLINFPRSLINGMHLAGSDFYLYLLVSIVSLCLLALSAMFFRAKSPKLIERLLI